MLIQFISILGASLSLGAFAGLQLSYWEAKSHTYLGLNVAAAVLLGLAAVQMGNIGFTTLNVVWGIVALNGFRR